MIEKSKVRNFAIISGIYLLLFYNFHRYIFQYNSEGTSPTYTNTPLFWKTGKYLLVILILALLYVSIDYRKRVSWIFVPIYSLVFIIILINLSGFAFYRTFSIEEFTYCLWFLLLLPYCFAKVKLKETGINFNKHIKICVGILYASNAFAIANYYLTGRLPALGYEGGLIRYGGFWDDPNGFGVVCVFCFFYFWNRKNYLFAVVSLANLVMTVSFTGYVMLAMGAVYWVFSSYKQINFKWIAISLLIVVSAAVVVLSNLEPLLELYELKSGSIDEHLNTELVFNIFPLSNIDIQFSENWYKSSFYNYFPLSILIHLTILIFFLSLFHKPTLRETKFYFFIFILTSNFFSMLYIFPLNIVFVFLLIDYIKYPENIITERSLVQSTHK